jgi:hypothetical protein
VIHNFVGEVRKEIVSSVIGLQMPMRTVTRNGVTSTQDTTNIGVDENKRIVAIPHDHEEVGSGDLPTS